MENNDPLILTRRNFLINISTPGKEALVDDMREAFERYSIMSNASATTFMETILAEAKGQSSRSASKPEDIEEIERLRAALEKATSENDALSLELIEARKLIDESNDTTLLEEANQQIETLTQSNEELTNELEKAQADFNDVNYQITQLQGKVPNPKESVVLQSSPANIFILKTACDHFKMSAGKLLLEKMYIEWLINGPSDLEMPFKNFSRKTYDQICAKYNTENTEKE